MHKILLLCLFCPLFLVGVSVEDLLPKDPLIFDVGAHVGDKTALYLSKGARLVVCIEPNPTALVTLQNRHGKNPKVVVEPVGLSSMEGTARFFPAEISTLSTMAEDWKEGRFKKERWHEAIEVPVSTLDCLIAKYGIPDFCKIDVEGYEELVLQGLSQPLPCISFEFAYEFLIKKTKPCLDYLVAIGFSEFNVAFGENPQLVLDHWVDKETLLLFLTTLKDPLAWGDVYAR